MTAHAGGYTPLAHAGGYIPLAHAGGYIPLAHAGGYIPLAHAGGTGWDEIVLALMPLAVSTVLFVALHNRLFRNRRGPQPSHPGGSARTDP